jgi:hypothetical protein
MAKQLTQSLHTDLESLLTGKRTPSRLTPAVAVQLAQLGILKLENGKLALDKTKAKSRLKRFIKRTRQIKCNNAVEKALGKILKEDAACTQHRQVWITVGRNEFSREEVLKSLQVFRSDGLLRSFKSSTNNFQVFWAKNKEVPAGDFEVNGEQ